MLIGHKTPDTLVTEITMHRMSHDGAFLIVEGNDDVRFWTSRHHTNCELVNGEGKRNVVGGIQRLDVASFAGVLGIVDSDYDPLNGMDVESENLLTTDAHDLECLLCRSSALDRVLAEHGSRAKIEKFENETGADVRTGLLERTLVFGRLRWAAVRCHPVIGLKGFNVPKFVDESTWSVASEKSICNTFPREHALTLMRRINDLPEADPWYIVRGHDMLEILRIGLRHVLGEMPANTRVKDIIGSSLRLAMSQEDLQETRLWADMRTWEATNRPYLVLAD